MLPGLMRAAVWSDWIAKRKRQIGSSHRGKWLAWAAVWPSILKDSYGQQPIQVAFDSTRKRTSSLIFGRWICARQVTESLRTRRAMDGGRNSKLVFWANPIFTPA